MNPVFYYKANIVDYVRLALLLGAFYFSHKCPFAFLGLYALSQLMDMLDGYMARKYDQCSTFGAVLDMVLDRASNSMFYVLLGAFYPEWTFVFGTVALLDLCSHWTLMYSAVQCAKHHKTCTNPVLRFYYTPKVLASVCAGNEACLISLYVMHWGGAMFEGAYAVGWWGFVISGPIAAFKVLTNVLQWYEACNTLAIHDEAEKMANRKPVQPECYQKKKEEGAEKKKAKKN